MIVGCYDMHLYCDNPKCDRKHPRDPLVRYPFPDEYTGRSYRDCVKEAKRRGWLIRAQVAVCPHCAARGVKPMRKMANAEPVK